MKKFVIKFLLPLLAVGALFLAAFYLNKDSVQTAQNYLNQLQGIAGKIGSMVIYIALAWIINRMVQRIVWRYIAAKLLEKPVPKLLQDLVTILIYTVAAGFITVGIFNFPLTGFIATSGVIGLVLGFALRSLIQDLFTGLAVSMDDSIKIGDWVHINTREINVIGELMEINWRTTRIRTEDNTVVLLPNSTLGTTSITNYHGISTINRTEVVIVIDFDIPPERVKRIALNTILAETDGTIILHQPEPVVVVRAILQEGVEYLVRFWIKSWKDVPPTITRDRIYSALLHQFHSAGVTFSYPKQDVYHKEMPSRNLHFRSPSDLAELLAKVELFASLTSQELFWLAGAMKPALYKPKEDVIKIGESGDSMFLVTEGVLDVFLPFDGQEKKVAQIVPGQFFGEGGCLTGEKRSATVRALTDVVLYTITKETIAPLFRERPALVEIISGVMAERKTRNSLALNESSREERESEAKNLTGFIRTQIKNFFSEIF